LRLSGLPAIKTLEQFDFKFASGAPRSASGARGTGIYRAAIEHCVTGSLGRRQEPSGLCTGT
jgi:hypothetical protein